jgi:hypothetical protein
VAAGGLARDHVARRLHRWARRRDGLGLRLLLGGGRRDRGRGDRDDRRDHHGQAYLRSGGPNAQLVIFGAPSPLFPSIPIKLTADHERSPELGEVIGLHRTHGGDVLGGCLGASGARRLAAPLPPGALLLRRADRRASCAGARARSSACAEGYHGAHRCLHRRRSFATGCQRSPPLGSINAPDLEGVVASSPHRLTS